MVGRAICIVFRFELAEKKRRAPVESTLRPPQVSCRPRQCSSIYIIKKSTIPGQKRKGTVEIEECGVLRFRPPTRSNEINLVDGKNVGAIVVGGNAVRRNTVRPKVVSKCACVTYTSYTSIVVCCCLVLRQSLEEGAGSDGGQTLRTWLPYMHPPLASHHYCAVSLIIALYSIEVRSGGGAGCRVRVLLFGGAGCRVLVLLFVLCQIQQDTAI